MKNLTYVLLFTAMTAISWGAYGPLLGKGAEMGRWLPFVFVGVAYFLIGVVATTVLLSWRGEPGNWTFGGSLWSFLAGVVTAVGALGLILALANHGKPIYVMPLIFGGAPVVNTFVTMWMSKTYREAGPFFYAGLILVIAGAATVLIFKPQDLAPPSASQASANPESANLLLVLAFVALTALCWGCYGPLLHKGQTLMHGSRMRPFICVGVAYAVVAVIAPLAIWTALHDTGQISATGVVWSLTGGTAGALGSLGVILAFTFGGKPIYVMPLVFGGAPVVSTLISILTAKNLGPVSPFFYAGLIVVVAGAVSVLVFAPRGAPEIKTATPAPSPVPQTAKR